jgi:uncharacterized protein (TIGR02453 family)
MPRELIFPDDVRPDFEGFRPAAFKFLRDLKRHNERAWFLEHKETYESELRFPMECLVASFGPGSGLPVRGDAKRSPFRIHRDVRFSKDKSPYKTHVSAILSRSGGRGDTGILYIHIEPRGCFVSSGFYMPDPAFLTAWRHAMVREPKEFLAIAKKLTRSGSRITLEPRETLKKLPRGFEDHGESPVADYLRWKHFLASRDVTDEEAGGKALIRIVRDVGRAATPLLDYGWAIYDALSPGGR